MALPAMALACAAAQQPGENRTVPAASPAPAEQRDLRYLIGAWDIVATTPGTGATARFSYEVSPLLGSAWISGWGRSEDLAEESRDVWGFDAASGELIRIIFDRGGTHAIVRSPGWEGTRLVLVGDARSAGGVVRVRETIERLGDDEFVATWEAYRNGAWSAYSIERVTRRSAPAAG